MDALKEKYFEESAVSVNAKMMKFLTPMETASPVDLTWSSPMASVFVPPDTPSTAAVFALLLALLATSPSKEDVLFALLTQSSDLKSMVAIVLLDFTRIPMVSARDWS